MTTLSVTIDDTSRLQMLLEWLRSLTFVKNVEVNVPQKGNAKEISELLETLPGKGILSEITNPVDWQKQQRNEW